MAILATGCVAAAAHAQCVVPNTLANGQMADATKVMGNFNSLASCASAPAAGAAGSVQYNSGSGVLGGIAPLTNGQLVIGSTGGAPQAANLTAGAGITITNGPGNITLSAVGGVSGLYDISVGVPTSFTGVNLGGNGTVTTNGSLSLTVSAGASAPSGPTLYGVYFPAPTSTPYTVAILILNNQGPIRYSAPAIGFYDSTTGKLRVLTPFGFPGSTPQYSFETWASATSRSGADEPSIPRVPGGGAVWYGISDNGTTVAWSVSLDGANFTPLGFSEAKSGGYLSSYSNIFIGLFNDGESGSDGAAANENVSVTYLAVDPNGANRKAGP